MKDIEYLKLLSQQFKNREEAAIEIANLQAILSLPKPTEFFFSDLHGEYESFIHLLRAASGIIRAKLTYLFEKEMTSEEILELANIIYYPEEKFSDFDFKDEKNYKKLKELLRRLIELLKSISKKHTKSRIRKMMDKQYIYIIEELMYKEDDAHEIEKERFYDGIIQSIIDNNLTMIFIIKLCKLIRHMTVDELHIVGDICDRGPRQDYIFDELMGIKDVDIQWGNHDIAWMGAYLGNDVNLLSCLRIAVRYNCYDMLEDGYGINLRGLTEFVEKYYKDDEAKYFGEFILDQGEYDTVDEVLSRRMQKALAIMQFKCEGQLFKRHPEYGMNNRILLEHIDYNNMKVNIDGISYDMRDTILPTVDPNNPLKLNEDETRLLAQLKSSFRHSKRLTEHIKFLFEKGAVYDIINGNLLYHGIIPFDDDGNMKKVDCEGSILSGREYFDFVDKKIRAAYRDMKKNIKESDNIDYMYYLWCGEDSPFFGKKRITTFENYFVEEKETHKEPSNAYFKYAYEKKYAEDILRAFGLDEKKGHIINGHMPVKAKDGENPIKAEGKLYVIDGGLSKGYQSKTGIAGYTLIYDSVHITLASHKKFEKGKLNTPVVQEIEEEKNRLYVKDTDKGQKIQKKIDALIDLEEAFIEGLIKEA